MYRKRRRKMYTSRNKMLILFKRGFYCSGVSSYTEGAEGGTLDWPVNKVGGKRQRITKQITHTEVNRVRRKDKQIMRFIRRCYS